MAGKVEVKKLNADFTYYCIVYEAGTDCGRISGMKLTGGHPIKMNGIDAVKFENKHKGQQIVLKYDTRSDLAALVTEYKEIDAQKEAERKRRLAEKRAEEEAVKRPLLEAMNLEAEELRKQIPAGHVEVKVEKTGDLDGWPMYAYSADGITLVWQDVQIIGSANAIYPGALGAFAEIVIASIDRAELEQIKIEQAEKTAEALAKKEAIQKKLMETPIPQAALEDFNRYHGNESAAWEAEDEAAWASIHRWAPYIEAQYGVHPDEVARLTQNVNKEQNFGIND